MPTITTRTRGSLAILKEISKRLDLTTGAALKDLYLRAAQPILTQARQNIDSLPISDSAKAVLKVQVVAGRGPKRLPNAFVAMYQWAANVEANHQQGHRVPNPYWFEFGTAERVTASGHKTGHMGPTPYFRPAVVQARGEVRALLVQGLKDLVVDGKESVAA